MALTEAMKKQKQGHPIECIRNDSKLNLEIQLYCHEWTWNCPSAQQPDFGTVTITYTPAKLVAETKALKFYLTQYRYYNSFVEEVTERILKDFVFYVNPKKVKVEIAQTSRGGIQNTCTVTYDSLNKKDALAMEGYKPKRGFQGGWAMISDKG